MSKKSKENKKVFQSEMSKCFKCQNYDNESDSCEIDKNIKECSKTNFSKCQNFVWHERYTMF